MRDDRTGDIGAGTSALRTVVGEDGGTMSGRADALLWDRVKRRLRTELGEDVFSSWFARVEFESADGATVTLSVPTRFLKSWIQAHYQEKLLTLWAADLASVRRVELIVRGRVSCGVEPVTSTTSPPFTAAASSASRFSSVGSAAIAASAFLTAAFS